MFCDECNKEIDERPRIVIIIWAEDDATERTFCSEACMRDYTKDWTSTEVPPIHPTLAQQAEAKAAKEVDVFMSYISRNPCWQHMKKKDADVVSTNVAVENGKVVRKHTKTQSI